MRKQLSLFVVMAMILVSSVVADTVTLRPDAQGARTGWGNTGCSSGSSEYQCVDEVSLNTGDYLQTTGTSKESFTFDDASLAGGTTVNSVTMHYVAMQHNSASNSCFSAMVRQSSTDYTAGTQICTGANWTEYTHVYSTNPATGSAWTVSEIDGLEAGMQGSNPNGGGRVAQVWAVVDYTLPSFADLVVLGVSVGPSYLNASNYSKADMNVTVYNQGEADAGSFYLFAPFGGFGFLAGLGAGVQTVTQIRIDCPASYQTNVTADIFNSVTESNETNNKFGPFSVSC